MKNDKIKCLKSISDKAVCMRGQGRLHAIGVFVFLKVTDQIKYTINESLSTLNTGQWILKSYLSLECIKCIRVNYCGER